MSPKPVRELIESSAGVERLQGPQLYKRLIGSWSGYDVSKIVDWLGCASSLSGGVPALIGETIARLTVN